MPTAPTNVRLGGPIPVPPSDPHATFNQLKARPDCHKSYSLRSQAELDLIVSAVQSCIWRYLPGQPHPYAPTAIGIDAALMGKPPRNTFSQFPCLSAVADDSGDENVPGQHSLKIKHGRLLTSGIHCVRWDVRWRPELQDGRGEVNTFKTFFIETGAGLGGTGHFAVLKDSLTAHQGEFLAMDEATFPYTEVISNGLPRAPGTVMLGSSSPVLVSTGRGTVGHRGYKTKENVWQRYVVEIRLAQPGSAFVEWSEDQLGGAPLEGTWDMFSYWIGDENGQWRRMVYRFPHCRKDLGFSQIMLNWDTSSNNLDGHCQDAPYAADLRNYVAWTPPTPLDESDPVVFELPKA